MQWSPTDRTVTHARSRLFAMNSCLVCEGLAFGNPSDGKHHWKPTRVHVASAHVLHAHAFLINACCPSPEPNMVFARQWFCLLFSQEAA